MFKKFCKVLRKVFSKKKFSIPFKLPSWTKSKFLHTHLYIKGGTIEEEELSLNFQNVFKKLGQVLSGDEKLFFFSGKSGLIRYCPNKPTKMGLWNYQRCVMLSCQKPFLIFNKLQTSNFDSSKKSKISEIVKKWGSIILNRDPLCTLVFDSYYMSKESRNYLNENKIIYLGSSSSNKNKSNFDLLSEKVKKTGEFA